MSQEIQRSTVFKASDIQTFWNSRPGRALPESM